MRFSYAVAAGVVRLAAAAVPLDSISQEITEDIVPGAYIVELNPGSHLKRGFSSPHVELYHDLKRRDAVWEVQKEYSGELLTGVAVTLGSGADLAKLAQASGVQSITPVYIHPPPELADVRAASDAPGSAPPNDNAAGYARTGVDQLHAEGHFGKGITVAILDTGIDYTNPALGGKFGPGNKVAGGFDFVGDAFTARADSPPPTPDNDPLSQCNGHGTHVAGIIGADPNNNPHNISGVAHEATINAYRIFGCKGSTNDAILVDALNKAFNDGNDIINLSLGAPDAWGKSVSSLVASRIVSKGRIVTFAAGNDGVFGSWYTATGPGVISVGNVEKLSNEGTMNPGSTWGPSNDMFMNPSVSAPGSKILSTWPVTEGSYRVASGTSMAAPFVAGSAALLLQIRGKTEAAAKAMQNIFQNTAAPVPGSGASGNLLEPASHQGAGLIRVYDAMKIKGSMFPSELLLNDTANYRGSHEVSIRNDGNQTVTYTLSHSPAGTAPTININGNKNILGPEVKLIASSISVSISPSSVTVSPGQSLPVKVDIQAPTGLTPSNSLSFQASSKPRDPMIINTAQTPIIKDKNNQAISPNATFTLNDTDFPRIEYRLTAGTPRLLLDIIHPLPEASIEPRRLFRFARGSPTKLPKRPTWYGFSAAKRANPEDTFAGLDIVGRIFQKEYVSRHLEFGRNVGSASNIQQFANGTAIPDGAYQILLRALKIAGDPTKEDDWESWTSPVITVKRNP